MMIEPEKTEFDDALSAGSMPASPPQEPTDELPGRPDSAHADPEEEEKTTSDPPPADPTGFARWWPLAVAVGLPVLFFFVLPPLTRSGLWDPYELNVADLARRLAYNLYGAANLALDGADNSLPHLNDLGRPQLPFSSIALGFKLFGLHEWAGRMPLALWGVAGVVSTYAFVARLFDRRAGAYAAVALTTMPLYFVQARAMLGDICAMSALAMSFGGLAVAVFDRDEDGPTSPLRRLPWILLAVLGLLAGFGARGGLLGLGVPLLSIGIAWGLTWSAGSRQADSLGDVVGALSLLVGASVIFLSVRVFDGDSKDLSLWVGAMVRPATKYPTFDFYIASIGHALVPWSAFAPFAFGRLFLPPIGRTGNLRTRESFARMAILVAGAVVFAAHGYLAAKTDLIAFTGPAIVAAACGVALRDFQRGAHASVAVGVGTAVLCGLFHHDFHELPEKAYQAFAVTGPAFPESFKATALALWWIVLFGFAGVAFLTWAERDSDRTPFDPKNYLKILKSLREEFDGLLTLAFFASVAGAAIAALFVVVGARLHARWLPTMSVQIREVVTNAWWVLAFVPLGVILGVLFACDLWLWTFNRSRSFSAASFRRGFEPFEPLFDRVRRGRGESSQDFFSSALVLFMMALGVPVLLFAVLWQVAHVKPILALAVAIPSGVLMFLVLGVIGDIVRHRAVGLVLGGAALGFILCFSYYPALANQLSPKEVFESFQRIHRSDEPLALLGVGGRTAAYYAGAQPASFTDVQGAYAWLAAPGPKGARRYLAVQADQLPKLNQTFREHSQPRTNLPVLDARSSQILLAASSLAPGESDENPLASYVLSEPPDPQRKLDVNMDDKLQVLGIDILDPSGKRVESVTPNKTYHIRTYYRVLAPVTTEWEAFIHIDGFRRRHNGDHKVTNGKYPMNLWLPGDLLADDYEFKLEPNFTPGSYNIYFGLFVGESRLKVKSGPSDGENRINGGQLHVL